MRILVVSNLYPPHYIGGYELGCSRVVGALEARGHEIRVLTSVYGVGKPETDGRVYRWLTSAYDWRIGNMARFGAQLLRMELGNQAAFSRLCREWQPDVVYFWNLGGFPMSLVTAAQGQGFATCFFVSDNWLSRWPQEVWNWLRSGRPEQAMGRLVQAALRLTLKAAERSRPVAAPDLQHVQFCSQHLKRMTQQAGQAVEKGTVIPWGVDIENFAYRDDAPQHPTRALYVGRVVADKGVHTAIEAIGRIAAGGDAPAMTLTIAGGTQDTAYLDRLHAVVQESGLAGRIHFTGALPPEQVKALYKEHDILVFPSVWDEPFSITVLEGLASGLAVVGTDTGGTPEILKHDFNALVFPKEDSRACAESLLRLAQEPATFERIRCEGRRTVESRYTFASMVGRIETMLVTQVCAVDSTPGLR